jgi:Tfp pilus assembly protein PilF
MSDEQTLSALLELGDRHYASQEFEPAIAVYLEAWDRQPPASEAARIAVRLANAFDALGDYARALEFFQHALERDAALPSAWNNLGVVCRRLGKLDEAREAFERAFRLDPSNADVLTSLGAVALKQSDPGNALQYLDLALELQPGHAIAHANRALTLCVFGRLEEAEEALAISILHGFANAQPIEERIERLKAMRDHVLRNMEHDDDASGDSSPEEAQDAGAFLQLYEMHEQRLLEEMAASEGGGMRDNFETELQHTRAQIAALRERLGMPPRVDDRTETDRTGGT